MMKKGMGIYVAVFALAFLSPSVVAAEDGEKAKPWERFSLNLGGFIAVTNSDLRLGSQSSGVGIDVNGEDALGLDSSFTVFRADAVYRFTDNRRHRFDLSYVDLGRSATRTLQTEIQIKDQVFPVGTTIDTLFDLKIIRAAYSYSLFQDERIDLGLSGGLYVMPIKIRVSSSHSGTAEEESITAPLPVLGLRFDFAITPKFFLKQNIDFFYLQYQNFQGSLLDAKIALEYNVWKYLGFGIAYDYLRIQVKAEGQDYPGIDMVGKLQFGVGGLLLYGKIYF
jgi:hypothetical protein